MMLAGRNLLAKVRELDAPSIVFQTPPSLRYQNRKIAIVRTKVDKLIIL
jgi:hypothetical protein